MTEENGLKIERKITTATLVVLVLQAFYVIWWARGVEDTQAHLEHSRATIASNLSNIESRLIQQEIKSSVVESRLESMSATLQDTHKKVDKIYSSFFAGLGNGAK